VRSLTIGHDHPFERARRFVVFGRTVSIGLLASFFAGAGRRGRCWCPLVLLVPLVPLDLEPALASLLVLLSALMFSAIALETFEPTESGYVGRIELDT